MLIHFNLAYLKNDLLKLSLNDRAIAKSMLEKACSNLGFPCPSNFFENEKDQLSRVIFEEIENVVKKQCLFIFTPDHATIVDLNNLQFFLSFEYRNQNVPHR